MKDQFVTYEIALRLKELGFNEECLAIYTHNNEHYSAGTFFLHTPHPFTIEELTPEIQDIRESAVYILSPLLQQVTKWLREVHHIHIGIWYNTLTSKYRWERQIGKEYIDSNKQEFATYELALSEGLIEALKLLP